MRRLLLVGLVGFLLIVGPVWAAADGPGGPVVAGPLMLASGGCQPSQGCSFDYALDASVTGDVSVSWHGLWLMTRANGGPQVGSCTTEVTDAISWGNAGAVPSRTFPVAGTSPVAKTIPAMLVVDAGGKAARAGQLSQRIAWPAGLVTTVVGHGYMSVVWQGRTTRGVPLVLAAEVANPGRGFGQLGGWTSSGVGIPCRDLAPPGTTFLARLSPSTVRYGETAWLQLRIPDTYYHWTVSSKGVSVGQRPGKATIVITGTTGLRKAISKPIVENMSDRTSLQINEAFPGRYLVSDAGRADRQPALPASAARPLRPSSTHAAPRFGCGAGSIPQETDDPRVRGPGRSTA